MHENTVCDIELGAVTFWPPGLAQRLCGRIRRTVTLAIVSFCGFGIALGFAGACDQDDTMPQIMLHALAVFTGLIG